MDTELETFLPHSDTLTQALRSTTLLDGSDPPGGSGPPLICREDLEDEILSLFIGDAYDVIDLEPFKNFVYDENFAYQHPMGEIFL